MVTPISIESDKIKSNYSRRPISYILFICLSVLVIAIQFSGGINNMFSPYNLMFAIFTVLALLSVSEGKMKKNNYFFISLLLIITSFSFCKSLLYGFTVNVSDLVDLATFLICLFVPLLISNLIVFSDLKRLVNAFFLLLILITLASIYEYSTGSNLFHEATRHSIHNRVSGGTSIGTPVGGYISVVCISFIYLKFSKNTLIFMVAIIFALINIQLSGQRMAFILLITNILIIYFYDKTHRRYFILIFLVIVGILTIDFLFIESRFSSITTTDVVDEQSSKRLEGWFYSKEIIFSNPLLGIGLNDYKIFFRQIAPFSSETYSIAHPHSLYFHIALRIGLLGLIWFLIFWFFVLQQIFKKPNDQEKIFALILANSLLSPMQVSHDFSQVWFAVLFVSATTVIISLTPSFGRLRLTSTSHINQYKLLNII